MTSPKQENPGRRLSVEHRAGSRDHKPQAIVYDPSVDKFETIERETLATDCNSFPVHLPLWRNKVDIYVYPENNSGFVATVQLDRLGRAKNWQRRFRFNYKVLYVKGLKPEIVPRQSSSSSGSISATKDGDPMG